MWTGWLMMIMIKGESIEGLNSQQRKKRVDLIKQTPLMTVRKSQKP